MSFLSKFAGIAGSILKYGVPALLAVGQVQQEVGKSAGDPSVQQSKLGAAVTLVLAGAHAGESVPNTTVQKVAGVVEIGVSVASALGLFGKTANASGSISIPKD